MINVANDARVFKFNLPKMSYYIDYFSINLQILRDKRWKEVTSVFNFPSTATNASFVLRKYYHSLLRHYEQIYYFKSQGYPVSGGMNMLY